MSKAPIDDELLQLTIQQALSTIETYAPVKDKPLLHAMLEFAPTDNGKLAIACNILQSVDAKGVSKLGELATSYWTNIVVAIRSAGGKTPAPTQNPSRDGDPHGGELVFNPESAKRSQSYLKKHTLARDDYKCVITGRVDPQIFDFKKDFVPTQFAIVDVTQAAHIIPFSLNDFDDNDKDQVHQQTTIWTALQAFCGEDISALRGAGINSFDNVITLSALAHKFFGELQLALESTDTPNKYKVLTFGSVTPKLGFPATCTLTSATDTPVANPLYLALHTAVCKVLWSSGRVEALEKVLQDWEDTKVLAKDGSSVELLEMAIFRSVQV